MKKLLLIGTTVLALTSGSVTTESIQGSMSSQPRVHVDHVSDLAIHLEKIEAEQHADFLKQQILKKNLKSVNSAIEKIKTHVNKTWYVFSGATPSGWDCSGLTMWFYQQLGIEIEHRASKQDTSGKKVSIPKSGDIVVFHYKGNKDAYHVGIYIGNGKMIHAPKHGHLTRTEDVSTFGGDYSNITYRRLIETG